MSQTTNNRGKNPNNKSNKKDFFNNESGTYISFSDLKTEIEAGNISPIELYTDYEIYDASTDQAKELMELAIKKVTPKAAPQPKVDVQAIKDAANKEADKIKDAANKEADKIKDAANKEAERIKDEANKEADKIKDAANKEADKIKSQAAKSTPAADPDKPATKKSAKPEPPVTTGSLDALKLVEYVDDEAVIDVRVPGMSVDKIVAAINGKSVASKDHLEILGKYGLPVGILPVRKVGKKLVIAKKSADELSLNTIDDIIAAINTDDNK